MIHTSPTALGALGEPFVLPVVEFLSFGCLPFALLFPLFLLFAIFPLAQNTRAGSAVAGLTGGRFRTLALIVRQVSNTLREGEQDLAPDGAALGPGAAGPAAGLPGTRDEAGEERQQV